MKNMKTINLVARNFQILQWAAKVDHPRIKSPKDFFFGVISGILEKNDSHNPN